MIEIIRTYYLECAHSLPKVPDGHKCKRVHGHNYKIDLAIGGEIDKEKDWILDFAAVDVEWQVVCDLLDHRYLNEIIENPTAERIAEFIAKRLRVRLPGLRAVAVWETDTCAARWTA